METTHTNGAYDGEGVIWHQHSNKLMQKILEYFPKGIPVVDLGCGHNFYVSVLRFFGYDATGTDMVNLGSRYFFESDLTVPRPENAVNIQKINVISLEVGEHLPEDKLDVFLNNLTSFGGGDILMSWAVPGQAGHGHISCRSNAWVITEMLRRGYVLDEQKTTDLRVAVQHCHCSWFQNTLMYFVPTAEHLSKIEKQYL